MEWGGVFLSEFVEKWKTTVTTTFAWFVNSIFMKQKTLINNENIPIKQYKTKRLKRNCAIVSWI